MTGFAEKLETTLARVGALPEATRRAIFTEFSPARIRDEAATLIARQRAGEDLPLMGMLVSVKDLFDEKGQVTSAGSRLLASRAPAQGDAPSVARLKKAGALMFGRTGMSEFAYSGVGLNPHHGTPDSVLAKGVIPGGSSSGGAVTVAMGLTDGAIGTDTGGSLRIPAAANGIWGIKPSQGLIDPQGVHPLAPSYDTPGPMARNAADLRALLEAMSGRTLRAEIPSRLRIAVPVGAFTDGIAPEVAAIFRADSARLRAAGHDLVPLDLGWLAAAAGINRIIVSVEAHGLYRDDLDALGELGDPRVLARIRFAETLSASDIASAYATRAGIAARFDTAMQGFDALICPTLMTLPPTIAATERDFDRLNAAMLRNTSLVNLADGCAIAMPTPGLSPAWSMTMLVGRKGQDAALLAMAEGMGEVFHCNGGIISKQDMRH